MELSSTQIEKMKARYARQIEKMRKYNDEHREELKQKCKDRYNKVKEDSEKYKELKEYKRAFYYTKRGLPVPPRRLVNED